MISVLVPVYNYQIQILIENLLVQFETIDCKWEILIADDASQKEFKNENSDFVNSIDSLPVKVFQQHSNIGSGSNRNYLIELATYDWLLFLDSDVLPETNNFLSTYIDTMLSTSKGIISGNIIYNQTRPQQHSLRWIYGIKKEQLSLYQRKNNAIMTLRGANFAIKRALVKNKKFPLLQENYGFVDTRFFLQFNENEICVIENPVFHLGLEENKVFLEKTRKAVINAYYLLKNDEDLTEHISLITTYKKIKIFKRFLAMIFYRYKSLMERKLGSNNPSVTIFQLYKLLYLSSLDISENF